MITSLLARIFIFERARPISFCIGHFHWKIFGKPLKGHQGQNTGQQGPGPPCTCYYRPEFKSSLSSFLKPHTCIQREGKALTKTSRGQSNIQDTVKLWVLLNRLFFKQSQSRKTYLLQNENNLTRTTFSLKQR